MPKKVPGKPFDKKVPKKAPGKPITKFLKINLESYYHVNGGLVGISKINVE